MYDGGIKMKTMVNILKHVFVPLSAFLFLLIGILACFSSGVIEYYVLREFVSLPGNEANNNAWAVLIVFILEGAKYTLHFYSEAFKHEGLQEKIKEFDVVAKRKRVTFVKTSLAVLSTVCSIICFTNMFYFNTSERTETVIEDNHLECDEILSKEKKRLSDERTSYIEEQKIVYDYIRQDINSLNEKHENLLEDIQNEMYINRRNDLQEEANKMYEQISELQDTYNMYVDEITRKADEEYTRQLEKVEVLYGENGTERLMEGHDTVMLQTDNEYLSNFLMAISVALSGNTYSRKVYFIFTMSVAILIAVLLELCISFSQSLLSMRVESFMELMGNLEPLEEGRKIVKVILSMVFSILVCTAVYLVSSIVMTIVVDKENIRIALVTYAALFILNNLITIKKENIEDNGTTKPKKVRYHLMELFSDWFVPGSLAFVGYILIGFLWNGNFVYGDLNGLAIALGGMVARQTRFASMEFLNM